MKVHYMVESDTASYDSPCYEPACGSQGFWDGSYKTEDVTCKNCKRTEVYKYYSELLTKGE